MDVDTLLTRQMELHTSVRHPPKNPQGLVLLMDVMRNYKNYFESLRRIAEQFNSEPETVFQAFMYISVGGTVNFDRQHQDGSVPMHQAKVLARSNAVELASTLRKELPNSELMVYVGLSRDLRTTLRVKVEDGNDLKTAEASVREAVEYLNYIDRCAHHNPEKLFQFYMAEDPASLAALLGESDPLTMTQTMHGSTMRGSGVALPPVLDDGGAEVREPTPLPTPLSSYLTELKKQCGLACEASTASGAATRRLKAAQTVLDWVTAVPVEYFAAHAEKIVAAVASTLSLLATEKRSALCRAGCEVITVLVQRLSPEPVFLDDVDRGTCSSNPETFSGALAQWTASLAKGTYVTVAAISTAADVALRVVVVQSHGHLCVVKKLLAVLASGTQTELRRKCLGYLALCVAAAHAHRAESVRELIRLVGPVAVEYVAIGDSPSRKMARALCSVLRVLAPDASPTCRGALAIPDERVEHLVQQERPQVEPAVLGGPQDLEELLFEADAFVSSTRSSFSSSTPRHSGAGGNNSRSSGSSSSVGVGGGFRGRGRGTTGVARTNVPASPLSSASSSASPDGSVGGAAAPPSRGRGAGQPPLASRSTPAGSGVAVAKRAAGHPLGELRSPTRRHGPTATGGSSGPRGATNDVAVVPSSRKSGEATVEAEDGVYDTDSFLGSDAVPKKNARAEEASSVPVPPSLRSGERHTREAHRQSGGDSGACHLTAAAQASNDRLVVPLSLRNGSTARDEEAVELHEGHTTGHGHNALPAVTGEAAGAVRISRSLRRKIEENKVSNDDEGSHRMH